MKTLNTVISQTFPLKKNVARRFYKDFSVWSQCKQLVLLISSIEPLIRVKAAPRSTPQRWAVSSNRRSWTRGSWRWRCVVNSATGKHAPPARSAGCICQIKTSHDGNNKRLSERPEQWLQWWFGTHDVLLPLACSRINSPLGFTVNIRHTGTPTCL